MQKYWGNGFATETAKAAIKYGFKTLGANEIFGSVHVENTQSRKVLEKCGLIFTEKFYWKDLPCDWLKITKEDWLTLQQ